jgi:hypothetical protein
MGLGPSTLTLAACPGRLLEVVGFVLAHFTVGPDARRLREVLQRAPSQGAAFLALDRISLPAILAPVVGILLGLSRGEQLPAGAAGEHQGWLWPADCCGYMHRCRRLPPSACSGAGCGAVSGCIAIKKVDGGSQRPRDGLDEGWGRHARRARPAHPSRSTSLSLARMSDRHAGSAAGRTEKRGPLTQG